MSAIALPGNSTASVPGLARKTVFNVRDYGAKGDGTTNDTAAFTAAIVDVASNGGGTLYVPPGTYNANVVLTSRNDFMVQGAGTASVIQPVSGIGMQVTTCNRLRIDNLRFIGGSIGLSVNAASDGKFSRLQFLNQTTNCIAVNGDGSTETRWSEITGRNCSGPAYWSFTRTATGDVGGTYLKDVNFSNSNLGTGIVGFSYTAVGPNALCFVYMDNCVADSMTGDALVFSNIEYVWLDNCYMLTTDGTAASAGINLNSGSYFTITNCYISNYVTGGTCLRLQGAVDQVVMDNNFILGRTNAIDAQNGITNICLGAFTSNCANLTVSVAQAQNLAGVNTPLSFGVRSSPGGSAAGMTSLWRTGDTLPTNVFGGNISGNNQTAVQAQSDTGKGVFATSNGDSAVYAWNFTTAAPAVRALLQDAGTNDTTGTPLRVSRQSAGTAADGFGLNIVMAAEDSTTNDMQLATLTASWTTASHFSRKGRLTFNVSDAAASREVMRIEADGAAPRLGFFGSSAVVKPTVSGSKGANAALTSLMTALAGLGLVIDSTS